MVKTSRTPAFRTFLENMAEVRRLLQIHGQLGGPGPGRRWGTEVLNKSAVVLLIACWEAYLEDVASFAFDTALKRCQKPDHFPKEVIKRVGESLHDAKDQRVIWRLAGSGWKAVLSDYKTRTIEKFHNPNSNLGGHFKTGQRWSGQNRPTDLARNVFFLEIFAIPPTEIQPCSALVL